MVCASARISCVLDPKHRIDILEVSDGFEAFIYLYQFFHFLSASLPGTEAAHQLVVCVRNKCTAEEALNVLRDLPNPLREGDTSAAHTTYNPLKIDVFVQTLLNLGSKSISHSFAAISKFHYVFKVSLI